MLVWIPTEIFQTTIFAQMSGPLVSQWLKYLLVNIRTECGEHRSNNWDKWSKKILLSCQLTNLHQNTRISLTDGKYFSDLFWEWIVFQWFNSWRDIFYSLRKGVVERATYPELLQHPFLVYHEGVNTDISGFVVEVLDSHTDEDEKKSGWRDGNEEKKKQTKLLHFIKSQFKHKIKNNWTNTREIFPFMQLTFIRIDAINIEFLF